MRFNMKFTDLKSKYLESILTQLFILFSIIEIVAEFTDNQVISTIFKPLLLPILLWIYLLSTKKASKIYGIGLILNWLANIFFISKDIDFITTASLLFMLSRIFILIKVYYEVKFPSFFPLVIGTIPFLFLFTYLNQLIFENIDFNTMIIVFVQSIIVSIFGGLAIGNYVMKNNISSILLLVAALFFTLNIFLLGIKFYYLDLIFLKPLSMVFFLAGHFALLKFVLSSEKEQKVY